MKLPTKIVLGIVVISLVIALTQIDFSAEGKGNPNSQPIPETVVDVASDTQGLSTYIVALKTAGMVDTLNTGSSYTVFAPTDSAFSALPEGEFAKIMNPKQKTQLQQLLKRHTVDKVLSTDELTDGDTLKTLAGSPLVVSRKGDLISVNGVEISRRDIRASNGVVHVLDELLPADKDRN